MRDTTETIRGGVAALVYGFSRLTEPHIRSFVIIPLVINIAVLTVLVWLLAGQYGQLVDAAVGWLPGWLDFLSFLLWPLFAIMVLFGLFFSFTFLTNLIASPFNAFLAERIQKELEPGSLPEGQWSDFWRLVPSSIGRELQKIRYSVPRLAALFVLSFIPVINLLTPFLGLLFSSWLCAVQYCDFAADNEQVSFPSLRATLAGYRREALTFGAAVSLLTLVPIVNSVVMPAAVIGGTRLWLSCRPRDGATGPATPALG